jgi:beta-lactamase regulating signal transducer with metallopeptidase domain
VTLLFAWIWQGLALAAGTALVLRFCGRLDAATRHAIWWSVLAAVLVLPWLYAIDRASDAGPGVVPAAAAPLVVAAPPDWLLAVGVGLWLGTVLLGAGRLLYSLAFVARLKRESLELDAARQARLPLWSAARLADRSVTLRLSPDVRTACAVGLGRKAIVLPASLVEVLDDDALDQIVMHEHAHLERRDDIWRLAQTLVECVAGLHPAVRIAVRHIDLEREAACDDRVVIRTGAPKRYASCLADAAALASTTRARLEPTLLPGAVGGSSVLRLRICRLLDGTRRRASRVVPSVTAAGTLAIAIVVVAASQLDPLVTFDATRALRAVASAARLVTPAPIVRDRALAVSSVGESGGRPAVTAARRARQVPEAPPRLAATAESVEARSADESSDSEGASLLVSRSVVSADTAPAVLRPSAVTAPEASPWSAAADGGVAVGSAVGRGGVAVGTGAKKAGTSVAGFFARAGRAVGRRF